jgi:predicted small metal-binding protein
MKRFRCGDVVPGCTAEFQFATDQEILTAVAQHARQDHGLLEIPPALADQVRSHIVDTAA